MSEWKHPSNPTGGVRAFNIAGRMVDERERLYYRMTDEERRWRAQFVKDQILEPGDSLDNLPDEWMYATKNFIRRAYFKPLDTLGYWLVPKIGYEKAHFTRYAIGKVFLATLCIMGIHYQMKYNRHEWWKFGGFDVYISKPILYPDDEYYMKIPSIPDHGYYDVGFSKSPLFVPGEVKK